MGFGFGREAREVFDGEDVREGVEEDEEGEDEREGVEEDPKGEASSDSFHFQTALSVS
jgi:hypothetical protein